MRTVAGERATLPGHGTHQRYNLGCHCRPCTDDATRQSKLNQLRRLEGNGARRDGTAARRKIEEMRSAGMTEASICELTGLNETTIRHFMRSGCWIRRETEQKVLAAPIEPGPGNVALTSPHGTQRRLQALAYRGWPLLFVSGRLGWSQPVIHAVVHRPDSKHVTFRTKEAVREVFAELWPLRPTDAGVSSSGSAQARTVARRNGWLPAGAWDDIDNPDEVPNLGVKGDRRAEVVEDASELLRRGVSREDVAERLGLKWHGIEQSFRRCGVKVPEVLR